MTDTPNLADPLNWPVPEPRVEFGDVLVKCRCCDKEWHATATNHWWQRLPEVTDNMIRAYIQYYYREHAYQNWSA